MRRAGRVLRGVAVLLGALALAGGCASFQANRGDVAQRVETMLSEHEYAQALETIALVKPSHPDYRRLNGWRATIEKNAQDWEAEVIADVDAMIAADQWFNAELQLDEGLQKLPASEPLQRARERFLDQRGAHLAAVDHELMLARGRGLPAEIAALEKLAAVKQRDAALQAEVENRRRMLAEAERALTECGRAAAAAGQNARAVECLTVVQSIAPDPEIENLLAAARKPAAVKKQQQKAAVQKRAQRSQARKVDELRGAYNRSMQNGDLNAARGQLNELLKLQPTAALRRESERLDQRIKRRVDRSLEDGRNLYTLGDFQGARAIWVAALRLDPANQELKDNIARAERVLKKLKTLSDDQQQSGN